MLIGSPAKHVRDITDQDIEWKRMNTREYRLEGLRLLQQSSVHSRPLVKPEGRYKRQHQ